MRRIILLLLVGLALISAKGVVPAQSTATPTAPACSIRPLKPAVLEKIVDAGFKPAPDLVPSDVPVPAQASVAIFNTVSANIACTNANHPLRALTFFTDRYLAERFSGPEGADELQHLLASATRSPGHAAPEDQLVLVSISDLVHYSDGRIGAQVTTANVDAEFTDLVVFVDTDKGWRIDQVILGSDDSAGGTPTAGSQELLQPVG